MIETSQAFKTAVAKDGRTFRAKVVINGVEYTNLRECKINKSCEPNETLSFGSTFSSYITITIADFPKNIQIDKKKVTFYVGLKINPDLDKFDDLDAYEWIKLGVFNITNPQYVDDDVKFTAYDNFYLCEKIFATNLGNTAKISDILTEQCNKLGINYILNKEIFFGLDDTYDTTWLNGLTIREAISYLSSYVLTNAIFDENGNLKLIRATDVSYVISDEKYTAPLNIGERDIIIDRIECMSKLRKIDKDENGKKITVHEDFPNFIGSDSKENVISFSNPYYKIKNNISLWLNNLNNLRFRSCELNWQIADPRIQIGDIIAVKGGNSYYPIMVMDLELEVDGGCFGTIKSKFVSRDSENSFKGSLAEQVDRLYTDVGTFKSVMVDTIDAFTGNFKTIDVNILNVSEELNALNGKIDNLDVDNLDVKYAKIDMSNVGIENVGKLFADIGLLKDVNIVNGSVTGVLNGVRINGDLIVANTLKVKDLLLEGADGLIYQINALASGLSLSELTDEIYQRKLNGTDIVANSITGTQIAGKTITAREIDVFDLFAQNITATGTITGLAFKGGSININDVFTVNSAGYVKASSGRIGNFNLTQNYISSSFKTEYGVEWSNEVLKLDSGKIHFDYNNNFYRNTSATDLVKYLEINGDEILFHCSKEDGVSKSTTAQIILQSDSSNLDSHLLITCSRGRILTDCNFISNKNIITGIDKISSVDGVAGVALSQNGNIYLTSDTSPSLFFYNGNSTSYTHLIQAQSDQFYVSRTTTINGSVHIKNNSALWSKNTSGSNKQLIGISSSNNLFIGSSEGSECTGDTNIYAGEHISLYANRISSSYKATALELLREQTDNHRTILRPASNSGIYLGTTNYRFNTAFFANSITASDLKEKEVVHDFDFKVEEFIKGMKPIAYRRKGKEDTGERIHIGFGAQTTNQLIKQLGLGDLSMVQASIINADGSESSYHGENVDDNKLSWGLNYTEMIPYAFLGIQDLYMKYNQLEQENKMLRSQLEAFISELSTREVLI